MHGKREIAGKSSSSTRSQVEKLLDTALHATPRTCHEKDSVSFKVCILNYYTASSSIKLHVLIYTIPKHVLLLSESVFGRLKKLPRAPDVAQAETRR